MGQHFGSEVEPEVFITRTVESAEALWCGAGVDGEADVMEWIGSQEELVPPFDTSLQRSFTFGTCPYSSYCRDPSKSWTTTTAGFSVSISFLVSSARPRV